MNRIERATGGPQPAGVIPLAENLWIERFDFAVAGVRLGKVTTMLRLASGEVILHSAGPWRPEHVAAWQALGAVRWIVEATCIHDTFARQAASLYPDVAYLVPKGFPLELTTMRPLWPAPAEWGEEISLFKLLGMPRVRETVLLHRPSRTLVVADLVFNLPRLSHAWSRAALRWASGLKSYPGTSRLFRAAIRDRRAFARSVDAILAEDFDRVVMAHGDVIETGGRVALAAALGWR